MTTILPLGNIDIKV